MNEVLDLSIPGGRILFSNLLADMPLELLSQDVAAVIINGFCIDVGWYPECDPNGHYLVQVVDESWNEHFVEYEVRTPQAVIALVKELGREFGGGLEPYRAI